MDKEAVVPERRGCDRTVNCPAELTHWSDCMTNPRRPIYTTDQLAAAEAAAFNRAIEIVRGTYGAIIANGFSGLVVAALEAARPTSALESMLAEARRETWKAALNALKSHQESFVGTGGRDHKSQERQRRESFYVRGLDDARGALETAAAKESEEG